VFLKKRRALGERRIESRAPANLALALDAMAICVSSWQGC
jgi:hypothetical protein